MDIPSDRTGVALLALLAQMVTRSHYGSWATAVKPDQDVQLFPGVPAKSAPDAQPIQFLRFAQKVEFFSQENNQ